MALDWLWIAACVVLMPQFRIAFVWPLFTCVVLTLRNHKLAENYACEDYTNCDWHIPTTHVSVGIKSHA